MFLETRKSETVRPHPIENLCAKCMAESFAHKTDRKMRPDSPLWQELTYKLSL